MLVTVQRSVQLNVQYFLLRCYFLQDSCVLSVNFVSSDTRAALSQRTKPAFLRFHSGLSVKIHISWNRVNVVSAITAQRARETF